MTNFIPIAQPNIGEEERHAVDEVLRSGMLAQGNKVASFESKFSEYFSLDRPSVAVNSGTSALHLGLLAAGIGAGDEVIVPSFTFAATANAVALTGATPIFADISYCDFNIAPETITSVITERTRAIMPVHLYGHPAPMHEILKVADAHDLLVFEDAAQAHGASLNNVPVGSFGTFAAFSFYPTKNMTSGEGGMVVCATPELQRNVQLYRNQGMLQQYRNEVIGFNNRMTDIHAAIGLVQLKKIGAWTKKRQEHAAFYNDHLEGVVTPVVAEGAEHVYHQYTIRIEDDRDGFATALKNEFNVGSGLFYPVPVHRLDAFQTEIDLPETERAARECLSLPVHPSVTERQLHHIVEAVNTLAEAGA